MNIMLLDIKSVARQLNISETTVHRLIDRGELDAHRIGRQLRVDAIDLIKYVNRSKIEKA